MFKRVEKKLAKKKKEEELGITEEIREAIGLNDVDSDDSSSDESEASSSSPGPQTTLKRKTLPDDELDASPAVNFEVQDSGASDDAKDAEDEPGVHMTVEEALRDPFHIISIQPDIRGCIICPHKVLKNDTMASVHTRSQAHQRRMSKFKEVAASVRPDGDAREVLSVAFPSTPSRPKSPSNDSAPLSRRATKRIVRFEEMKTKRQKHKAAKARSMAARAAKKVEVKTGSESETSEVAQTAEPPKKKPKLNQPSSPGKSVTQRPPSTKRKSVG
ncbi:hypothetical protein BDM02DRAFT_3119272 [Thelephora ganbajun]|uniref:Uncharacterized protein n=1 Tax=Thelephora ganbajun TaxID=370292 RepID=A0ACB6Z944_THEGA|nr:hypothetical protein BDM02DRAFT_3119272 [Thelephora ganbajun]